MTLSTDVGTVTRALRQLELERHGADESSPYTVTITATNADQSVSSTSFSVQGSDVAPTVSANQSSVTQPEYTAVSNSGTFADVDDAVTISTDVGTVSQVGGQSGSWSWSGTVPDESSPYTVTITATNADQSVSSTSFSVQGSDVAPTVSANQASVTQPENHGGEPTAARSPMSMTR